jgi:hypothetical protein
MAVADAGFEQRVQKLLEQLVGVFEPGFELQYERTR